MVKTGKMEKRTMFKTRTTLTGYKKLGSGLGLLLIALALVLGTWPVAAQDDSPAIYVIEADGPIVPAMDNYIERGIETARTDDAALVILRLDTPGGAVSTMENIIQNILDSDVPVVVYVAPRGAIAGSAGSIITLAGHVAAMAPETAIGAASPVGGDGSDLDETLDRKAKNILTAKARSLTTRRSPEAQELAVRMITDAEAVSADEALAVGLIDYIASTNQALIEQLDGTTVEINGRETTLDLTGLEIRTIEMNLIEQLLMILTNPALVFTLLSMGILLIIIELSQPGGWVAGAVGASSLVLSLYGIGVLPLNLLGLILVGVALLMFFFELQMPGLQGFLSLGAAVSLAAGGYILFSRPEMRQYGSVPLYVILLESAMFGVIGAGIVYLALRVKNQQPSTGSEGMIGLVGEVRNALEPSGTIFVNGELWRATSLNGAHINSGEQVEVVELDGLHLTVQPVDEMARRKGPPRP